MSEYDLFTWHCKNGAIINAIQFGAFIIKVTCIGSYPGTEVVSCAHYGNPTQKARAVATMMVNANGGLASQQEAEWTEPLKEAK